MLLNKKLGWACLWILLGFRTLPGLAQNDSSAEDLDQAFGFMADEISIATGSPMPIYLAPAIASVITADDIKRLGARDLDELLETVPGLHVSRSTNGYNPIYIIRGIYSAFNPQVLILINGIPITNLYFGDRGQVWGGMPVNAIERIEIIRGPGSAVYGADAYAGTINIITKDADDIDGASAGIRTGSFNTNDFWFMNDFSIGGWQSALILEYRNTDGHNGTITTDAQTFFDNLTGTQASLAPGDINTNAELLDIRLDMRKAAWKFRLGLQDREIGTGAGVAQALDPSGRGEARRISLDLIHNLDIGNWNLQTTLAYFDSKQETDLTVFPAGVDFTLLGGGPFPDGVIGRPDVYERHIRASLSSFYSGFENHTMRIDVGYHLGDMYRIEEEKNFSSNPIGIPVPLGEIVDVTDTTPFISEEDRGAVYAFVQDNWKFLNDWNLTYGVRVDHYSDFGNTVNPRIALVHQQDYDKTWKILYGTAFRAPSFSELFAINNPVNIGNPNLDPEEIKTLEIGYAWVPTNSQFSANIFFYEMENVIQFAPHPSLASGNLAQNLGQQEGHGLEIEFRHDFNQKFGIVANFAYQHATDKTTDSEVGNAPEQQFYLRGDWLINDRYSANIQINAVRERNRAFGDPRPPVDDYTTVNLSLRGKLNDSCELALLVQNLFDEEVFEPSPAPGLIPNDIPMPFRAGYLEFRYSFK